MQHATASYKLTTNKALELVVLCDCIIPCNFSFPKPLQIFQDHYNIRMLHIMFVVKLDYLVPGIPLWCNCVLHPDDLSMSLLYVALELTTADHTHTFEIFLRYDCLGLPKSPWLSDGSNFTHFCV